MSQQPKKQSWANVASELGVTYNTLRAWRTEDGAPDGKDVDAWKKWIQENKSAGGGKGSGRIVVDGETFSAEDIRKWKGLYQQGIAIKEQYNGKLKELEYRQKAESLIPESEAKEMLVKTLGPLRKLLDAMPRQCAALANPGEPAIAELAMRNYLDERVFAEMQKEIKKL